MDSWFEPLRGVVCLVQILSGALLEGDRMAVVDADSASSKDHFSVQDIGLVLPKRVRKGSLLRGQMGYAIVGLRDPRQARPGSILVRHKDMPRVASMVLPRPLLDANISANSAIYASVHPMDMDGFDELSSAVDRLSLNDTGLEVQRTGGATQSNNEDGGPFLGPGLRVGFQGLLHMQVFQQRLADEFNLDVVITPPKVSYLISYLPSKHAPKIQTSEVLIEDLSGWPPFGTKFKVKEPMVNLRIMSPVQYAGNVMDLIKTKRGTQMSSAPIDEDTWLFSSHLPWAEVVTDFYDALKNVTAGYASFDVSPCHPSHLQADLCKVDLLLNDDLVQPLAFVCHRSQLQSQARIVCKKLKEVLPRQQFVIIVQAKVEGKIVASERIKAFRKDVLSVGGGKTVGGGDVSRKKKLLEKQKKGKKRQQSKGRVSLSQEAFNTVMSR